MGTTKLLTSLLFLFTLSTQASELPLPSFPANFEVAEYKGQKGCIPGDSDYMTAVAENAGTKWVGTQKATQSPKNGKYHSILEYNADKDIGYILADKGSGKYCLIDKISDFTYKKIGTFQQVKFLGIVTKKMCAAIPYSFQGICGNFKTLLTKLVKNGFELQWQAKNRDGNILTLLSGKGKSYVLTTDKISNATVITEASSAFEYKWFQTDRLVSSQK